MSGADATSSSHASGAGSGGPDVVGQFNPRALVLVPKSVGSQWVNELASWLPAGTPSEPALRYEFVASTAHSAHIAPLKRWRQYGGILLMTHDLFRSLVLPKAKPKRA